LGGCLCSFLHAGKLRNKKEKKELVFCKEERRIKKMTLEHPLSFPLTPSLLMAFFFQQQFQGGASPTLKLLLKVK
jgi:hypothetical protein